MPLRIEAIMQSTNEAKEAHNAVEVARSCSTLKGLSLKFGFRGMM